ncbi:MAG: T9SS type A sorting domain-containing protein [Gilvibacter sp.]
MTAQEFNWAYSIGGASEDFSAAISVDSEGNVYTVGFFDGVVDFDPGPGVYNLGTPGLDKMFIQKVNAEGEFLWAYELGGSSIVNVFPSAISIDGAGDVVISGVFRGAVDFDPGIGSYVMNASGPPQFFILKLDSSGAFLWSKHLKLIEQWEEGCCSNFTITIDEFNNIYSAGAFVGVIDFDPGDTVFEADSGPGTSGYILKLDASGNFVWVKILEGHSCAIRSIKLDTENDVVLTGNFIGEVDFDPNEGELIIDAGFGGRNLFIQKLSNLGELIWVKTLIEDTSVYAADMVVDDLNNIYITGEYVGNVDFDPGSSSYFMTSNGVADAFLLKVDSLGEFVYAKGYGGSNTDHVEAMAIDSYQNIFITGYFIGTVDFDPSSNDFFLTSAGGWEVYALVLSESGGFGWAISFRGEDVGFSNDVFVTADSEVLLSGRYRGTADFDPGDDEYFLTSNGDYDGYLVKLNDEFLNRQEIDFPNVAFFPNPVNDVLTVELELDGTIEFYSVLGVLLKKVTVQKGVFDINLNDLKSGVYFISIMTTQGRLTKKIIKE